MWTKITRPQYERKGLGYSSDLSDAEWAMSPSAGVIDSQSVKTTEAGGPRGGACPRARHRRDPGDAAKKIKSRKRHVVTDTTGLLLGGEVHPADMQDRDGAPLVIATIHDLFP